MAELLEGEILLRRERNGRVVITEAPPTARISLDLLATYADRFLVRVSGNRVDLAGQITYRVVGWDQHGSALLLEREDPPDAGGLTNDEAAAAAWPAGAGTKGA
jgi:hypothetical protein